MDLSLIPWDVREEHRDSYLHAMLERESLRREGLPCGTAEELAELERWKAALVETGAVVDYVPSHPLGFVLVYSRTPGDGALIAPPRSA